MNYAEARRQARKMFGENAEVHRVKSRIAEHQYEVGVVIAREFKRLGVGSTWAKAFESVKETTPGLHPECPGSSGNA